MKPNHTLPIALLLLLLLFLAGCGKAASMKNYRAYASGIVSTYITDEDQREDMLKTIKGWKKEADYDNFAALMSFFSNSYIKTYDSWVAAGCPTPLPTVAPTAAPKATTAAAATAQPAPKATAAATTQTAPAAQTQTAIAAATPAPVQSGTANAQSGTAAVGSQPGGASGGSGEPSGTPPAN